MGSADAVQGRYTDSAEPNFDAENQRSAILPKKALGRVKTNNLSRETRRSNQSAPRRSSCYIDRLDPFAHPPNKAIVGLSRIHSVN